MNTLLTCPHCGTTNEADTESLRTANCRACGVKLADEQLISYDPEREVPAAIELSEQELAKWTERIGDHDRQTVYVEDGFFAKMKKYASKIPFAREALSLYYCATDPSTPITAKATAVGALAYWILPVDLIPDLIPIAGIADDASAVYLAYRTIRAHMKDEHREKAEAFFRDGSA